MGAVAMGIGGSYQFEGYTITEIAYCLYCDRCGSFKIGKRPTLFILIVIVIAAIVGALFWNSVKNDSFPGIWLACFGFLPFLIIFAEVFGRAHRCKKCGNLHISRDNVLNYQADDRSILDVPYEQTIRYYQDDM